MPGAPTALLTDLYQLNMLAAYLDHGLTDTAVFELFVRKLPARRGFLMAAGLEQALDYLETLAFSRGGHRASCGLRRHSRPFARLPADRFASPAMSTRCRKGTVFFADEPIFGSPRRCRRRSSSKLG